jgi:hypothetical protein
MSGISHLNPRIRILRFLSLGKVREDLKAAEMTTNPREVAPDLSREEDTTMPRTSPRRAVQDPDIRELPATTEEATEVATEAETEAATVAVTEVTARDHLGDTTLRRVDQALAPAALLLADTTIEVAAAGTTGRPRPEMGAAKVDIPASLSDHKSNTMMSWLSLKGTPEEALKLCITATEVA